jgi:hypothetical protein
MSEPRTIWTYTPTVGSPASFYQLVGDEYQARFDGKWQYTKDLVLGATTAAQSYIDMGAFEVTPLNLRCEFDTSALRNAFQTLHGTVGTLSNTNGLSYAVLLVEVRRIENGGMFIAESVWEAR